MKYLAEVFRTAESLISSLIAPNLLIQPVHEPEMKSDVPGYLKLSAQPGCLSPAGILHPASL